jgi:zinc protease
VPRNIPAEPPHTQEERVTVRQPWPLPVVVVSHHITRDGHPDAYPLHILAKILSDGDSSRLYQSLVYEKQVALAAFGEAKLIEHPNLFYAVAIVNPGHQPDAVLKALQAELDRIKTEGVTLEELNRAKRQFARDYILGRDTVQLKALHLAHAIVIHDDITTADGEWDLFQNVSQADIQRVAKTYFTPNSRMLLTILPQGRGGDDQAAGGAR